MLRAGEPGMSFAGVMTNWPDHSLSPSNGYGPSAF